MQVMLTSRMVCRVAAPVLVNPDSRKARDMGNLQSYKRIWGTHHDKVKHIHDTWSAELQKWERYRGSEAGDEHIQVANDAYTTAISAERDRYWQEMLPVLKSMREKVENVSDAVTLPSDEQMRLLQAVSLVGEGGLSYSDYQRYLELCADSSVARKTLYSLAKTRVDGGENLHEPSGPDSGADRNFKTLFENARSFARWNGTSRSDAIDAFIQERTNGVPVEVRQTDTAAAYAGDVDPTSSTFFKDVIGIVFDGSTIDLLD